MVPTGSIFLMKASGTVAAWLLTKNGVVEATFVNARDVSSRDRHKPPEHVKLIAGQTSRLLGRATTRGRESHENDDDGAGVGDLVFSVGDGLAAVGGRQPNL